MGTEMLMDGSREEGAVVHEGGCHVFFLLSQFRSVVTGEACPSSVKADRPGAKIPPILRRTINPVTVERLNFRGHRIRLPP